MQTSCFASTLALYVLLDIGVISKELICGALIQYLHVYGDKFLRLNYNFYFKNDQANLLISSLRGLNCTMLSCFEGSRW